MNDPISTPIKNPVLLRLLRVEILAVFLAAVSVTGCGTAVRPKPGPDHPLPEPASAAPKKGKRIVMTFGGDVLLFHWPIRDLYKELRKTHGEDYIYDYPFEKVKPFIRGLAFCNHEGPLTDWGPQKFADKDERSYFAVPPQYAKTLARAGFKVVSLANNHLKDCGPRGVMDSIAALKKEGLVPVGAGANEVEARAPVFIKHRGVRVGFLAYDLVPPRSVWAGPRTPGAAHADHDGILADAREARKQCDILVVHFHWGKEYRKDGDVRPPGAERVRLARDLIDAGALIVVGEHSHTVEAMERYGKGIIFYGLGNFVFGAATREGHPESMIVQVEVNPWEVTGHRIIPILISPRKTRYRPLPLEGAAKERFLKRLGSLKVLP